MSTRTDHSPATTTASSPALSAARRTGAGRDDSGIMLRASEVALLRVSSKPGEEGNELILRSGITVPLTYPEAAALRAELLLVEKHSTNYPDPRKMLIKVVC